MGNVKIRSGCLVGTGVAILQGKIIEAGAIIGAGVVVINDIVPDSVNVGAPTREVKKQDEKNTYHRGSRCKP